jgi:predicted nucleotidyltransferase
MSDSKVDKNLLDEMAQKYQLRFIVLFGSRTDGSAREDSDFDIAYSAKKEIDYGDEVFLAEDISRVFSFGKVDIVNTTKAGPLLMREIADKGQLLAEFEPNSFDKFQMYAFARYFEAKPLFKMQAEYVERNAGKAGKE